jgi:hypothetical protein
MDLETIVDLIIDSRHLSRCLCYHISTIHSSTLQINACVMYMQTISPRTNIILHIIKGENASIYPVKNT